MPQNDSDFFEIGPCQPEYYGAALWLVTGGRSLRANRGHVTALLAAEKQGKICFDGLIVARRGSRIVGAAWCVLQPGRIVTLWGPTLLPSEQDTLAAQLVQHGRTYARREDAHLIQSLVSPEQGPAPRYLKASGFGEVTQVRQLLAYPEQLGLLPPDASLDFNPAPDIRDSLFQHLVAQTYEGSLDCPELDEMRRVEDVLDGYLATSSGQTEHWYTIHEEGQPVGTILLAHHAQIDQLELIYFGLLPSVRRRGLGGELIRFALHLGAHLRCESVTAGVDVRNAPAVSLYNRFGFQVADSKSVFLLPLKPPTAAVA